MNQLLEDQIKMEEAVILELYDVVMRMRRRIQGPERDLMEESQTRLKNLLRIKHNDLLLRLAVLMVTWDSQWDTRVSPADFQSYGFDRHECHLLRRMGVVDLLPSEDPFGEDNHFELGKMPVAEVTRLLNAANKAKLRAYRNGTSETKVPTQTQPV